MLTHRVSITRYNFPGGHIMNTAALYGSLAAGAVVMISTWRWRVAVLLLVMVVLLSVSVSCIAVGASYLSDPLASLVEGVAWLALCLTAVCYM